jgi:16S rRNA (cytidine1402-2'-O)-methyltransferase
MGFFILEALKVNKNSGKGRLVLAFGSLGLMDDVPLRSLEALRTSDLLLFEEDRGARQYLKAAGIHREYLRLSEHRESLALEEAEAAFKRGQTVVYMSDQGAPNVADPGSLLIDLARRYEAKIQVIPGPSSITAAMAACPFKGDGYTYVGFLPRQEAKRKSALNALKKLNHPAVILETPYRLSAVLSTCCDVFEPARRGLVALDISGQEEDYWIGTFDVLLKRAKALNGKLNFVLVIEGGI